MCLLMMAGLNEVWWPYAMKYFCLLMNITEETKTGLTAWMNRHQYEFKGQLIPFGSAVDYKPSTPADIDEMHSLGGKTKGGS